LASRVASGAGFKTGGQQSSCRRDIDVPVRLETVMLRVKAIIIGLPIATLVLSWAAGAAAAVDLAHDLGPVMAKAQAGLGQAWAAANRWVVAHYATTPALIVGLAAVVLLPPLALVSGLIARLALPQANQLRLVASASAPAYHAAPDHPSNMAWPREAWLTSVVDANASTPPLICRMPRELLSIGRGEDNDLVLDEVTVHRTHALIQRTAEALFLIKDLGGPEGNGVVINGERVTDAHLLDGDRITLGHTTLIFHTRRVGSDTIVAKIQAGIQAKVQEG
jgi:FHA domain